MASIDFRALTASLSGPEPCGPDLDLGGNPDYMNYVARAEGILPATFFSRDTDGRLVPFDRSVIDFGAEFRTLSTLLEATRDLRLLTLAAKFSILNRDLEAFASAVAAMAHLIKESWDHVHPRGEDGDFTLRMVSLQTLDDGPTIVLPLQHAPLVQSRRFGVITYRNVMVAHGEAAARDGEDAPDVAAIESALRDADLATLTATRALVDTLKTSLATITATWLEKVGYSQTVSFSKLSPLVDNILAVLDGTLAGRVPAPALPSLTAPELVRTTPPHQMAGQVAPGRVRTVPEAATVLAAVSEYFARSEPSSPALLLVRQAHDLIGKSFQEVIRTLLPAHAEQATIRFGGEQVFELPLERLSSVTLDGPDPTERQAQSFSSDQGAGADQAGTLVLGSDGNVAPVSTRREAILLLEDVGAFYRASEPASPIPVLTDRACSMAQKDFLSLLKDVLPSVGIAQDY